MRKKMILIFMAINILIVNICCSDKTKITNDLDMYATWFVMDFTSGIDENEVNYLNISILNENKKTLKYISLDPETKKYKVTDNNGFQKDDVLVIGNTLRLSKVIDMHNQCNNYIKEYLKLTKYGIKIKTKPAHYTFCSNNYIYKFTQDNIFKEYDSKEFNGYLIRVYYGDEIYQFCFE
ncbi:MAG: hypothetical protein PHT78_07475 [Desulfitobacteriaceae bacterium]|nr:hypothetical protein [Desulfitobacteriaceae bacterium]MDD4753077.1 hypothetical protein [Desulfitobacteriaceae bacterium]